VRWRGILIGGALGFAAAGPFGAVLGALIGGALDDGPRPERRERLAGARADTFSKTDRSFLFVLNLVGLMTVVARADGSLDNREVRAMRLFFEGLGFHGEDLNTIRQLMKEAVSADLNLLAICREYERISTYEERLLMLRALYLVAAADGQLHENERSVIDRVVNHMGIGHADHRSIRSEFDRRRRQPRPAGARTTAEAYAALGIQPTASDQEVKAAYRNMARKYHPDRVNHLGEEFVRMATEKFQAIHRAYTAIRQERGLS
jgi:DnaJ like chaperone protein